MMIEMNKIIKKLSIFHINSIFFNYMLICLYDLYFFTNYVLVLTKLSEFI
jgi:hypothetical protein